MNDYPPQNNQPQQQPYPETPYQPPMPPAPPPRKKRGPLFWAVLTVGIIIVLIIGGNAWNAAVSSQVSSTTAAQPQATQAPDLGATAMAGNTPITSQPTQAAPTDTPAPTQAPATWKTTHTFTGNGIKKTATFSVPDDWKILYTCTHQDMGIEGVLGVMVYTSDNTIVDVAVNATCKPNVDLTKGETEEHQGGDIYLSIDGTGDWTVQVQELQ